jgi:hypothetical protein
MCLHWSALRCRRWAVPSSASADAGAADTACQVSEDTGVFVSTFLSGSGMNKELTAELDCAGSSHANYCVVQCDPGCCIAVSASAFLLDTAALTQPCAQQATLALTWCCCRSVVQFATVSDNDSIDVPLWWLPLLQ